MITVFCKKLTERENGLIVRKYINDIAKELFRKVIHLCTAFIPLLLSKFYWPVMLALVVVLFVYVVSEYLRLRGIQVPLLSKITEAAARKRDENKFVLGPVTLAIGVFVTALFFKPLPATLGIYALSFGDGLASLFGKLFGKTVIPFSSGKTVAGSLTCFFAIFCSSYIASKNTGISLILAGIGMLVELLPLKDFDNLIIPVLIAAIAQFLLP